MRRRCHVEIEGEVQDVGLRGAARREAAHHHLTGWIRNEPSGAVVAEVEGEAAPVALFLAWLRQKPGYASPTNISVTDIAPQGDRIFTIAR